MFYIYWETDWGEEREDPHIVKSFALISYLGKIKNEENLQELNNVLKCMSLISNHCNFYTLLKNVCLSVSEWACTHVCAWEEKKVRYSHLSQRQSNKEFKIIMMSMLKFWWKKKCRQHVRWVISEEHENFKTESVSYK